jgi:hypothetical protein
MRVRPNWIKVTAWAAALIIAGSVTAAAIRAGNWNPVYTAGWLVPVIIGATSANRSGHCLPRRGRGRGAGEGRAAG